MCRVLVFGYPSDDASKLFEVCMLLRLQRMLLEKLHDIQQALDLSNAQFESIVMISSNDATSEESLQCLKNLDILFVLDDPELW